MSDEAGSGDGDSVTPEDRPARRLPYAFGRLGHRPAGRQLLSLALQGGGSFGAFTWGVLDRLLQAETIEFDVVSGASGGAVNAVLLADGLTAGGPAEARLRLERFWRRVGPAASFGHFGGTAASAATAALELSTRLLSPYQLNPFGLNPLRELLGEIDFARLRAASPVRLLVAATQVKNGRARLFREDELTLEAVLASACLPLLHHAVEIEGEWYWDGGYSANPPLRQLVLDSRAEEVLLVQLLPEEQGGVPHLSPEIGRRMSQIAFNAPLQREIEALADLTALGRENRPFRSRLSRKLQRLRLHRLAAEDSIAGLQQASALNVEWAFLERLRNSGQAAAESWLAEGSVPSSNGGSEPTSQPRE